MNNNEIIENNQERKYLERNKLLALLLNNHTIEDVISMVSQILKKPIVVIDINFEIRIMEMVEKINDPSWFESIKKGYCSYEFILEIQNFEEVNLFPTEAMPYGVKMQSSGVALVSPMIIKSKYAGALVMFFDDQGFDKRESDLLLLANEVMVEIILKMPKYKHIRGYLNEGVIIDLINGRDKEDPNFKFWLSKSGLNIDNRLRVLQAEKKDRDQYRDELKESLRDDLNHILPKSYMVFYGNQMVILYIDLELEKGLPIKMLLKNFINRHHIKIGVSDEFRGIEDFQHYYFQAGAALRIGKETKKEVDIYFYEDYKFYHLLELVEEKENQNLSKFVHSSLTTLYEYDLMHKSELYRTLSVFMNHFGNYKKSCEALHIHRNTLSYRIERIKILTNLDFNNSQTLFDVAYSFKINRYIGLKR